MHGQEKNASMAWYMLGAWYWRSPCPVTAVSTNWKENMSSDELAMCHYLGNQVKRPWGDAIKEQCLFKTQWTLPTTSLKNNGPTGCHWICGGDYLLQSVRHLHLYFDTFSFTPPFLTLTFPLIFFYKSNELVDNIWLCLCLNLSVGDSWTTLRAIRTGQMPMLF